MGIAETLINLLKDNPAWIAFYAPGCMLVSLLYLRVIALSVNRVHLEAGGDLPKETPHCNMDKLGGAPWPLKILGNS